MTKVRRQSFNIVLLVLEKARLQGKNAKQQKSTVANLMHTESLESCDLFSVPSHREKFRILLESLGLIYQTVQFGRIAGWLSVSKNVLDVSVIWWAAVQHTTWHWSVVKSTELYTQTLELVVILDK